MNVNVEVKDDECRHHKIPLAAVPFLLGDKAASEVILDAVEQVEQQVEQQEADRIAADSEHSEQISELNKQVQDNAKDIEELQGTTFSGGFKWIQVP